MAEERENPYSNFNFVVLIDGQEVAAFSDVGGLDSETTPIDYREGADATNALRRLPGVEKYSAVTLKRGITGSLTLWKWRQEVRDSTSTVPPRKEVTIKLLNEKGDRDKPAMTFRLRNAWPSKLTGPTLAAKGNEIAMEQLDLVHERLDIE